MYLRLFPKFFANGLLLLVIASLVSALAAANTVPGSRMVNYTKAITVNDLKPPECASLNLNTLVTGSGTFNGTNGNDLILGSPIADKIAAQVGSDCIVGGGGDDIIDGFHGDDVLLGGPGADDLDGGNGTDYCYSGVVNKKCEFIYP